MRQLPAFYIRLSLRIFLCAQLAMTPGVADALCFGRQDSRDPWRSATKLDTDGRATTRFIPPELYSGASWDGDRAMRLRTVNVTRKPQHPSDHPPITITGPHPAAENPTLETLHRERVSGRKGAVSQVFRINERGDGLGRISDFRRDRKREMDECFKFPLGEWRQHEERHCRGSVIKIIELDYEYACVPHSLKFRWNNEGTYIFTPELGMVVVEGGE